MKSVVGGNSGRGSREESGVDFHIHSGRSASAFGCRRGRWGKKGQIGLRRRACRWSCHILTARNAQPTWTACRFGRRRRRSAGEEEEEEEWSNAPLDRRSQGLEECPIPLKLRRCAAACDRCTGLRTRSFAPAETPIPARGLHKPQNVIAGESQEGQRDHRRVWDPSERLVRRRPARGDTIA